MYQRIAHIALIVDNYDDAIEFYTQKLDFQVLEDTKLSEEKRWVMISPKGAKECCLLLAKAVNDRQIKFVRPPETFEYGTVAVFEDLYGNLWDLIEPNENNKGIII